MTQQQKTEASLQSEYQNIDEYYRSCIDFISSIISKDDLNSKEISNIKQIISSSLEMGYVDDSISSKITDILTSSTNLTGYSFRKNYLQLFPSLESIFDKKNSFYTNNSNNKNPSFPWTIVVDNFVRSTGIELILNYLDAERNELSCEHFYCFAKILNSISLRIENTKYQDILKRITKSLTVFSMKSDNQNPKGFIQLYSIYFKLCSGILFNSNDYSVFITLLNKSFKIPLLQNFGCQQIIILLGTPAKNLIITQEYCDFILSLNLTNENTNKLSPLYIQFAQNNLLNLTNLELLNKQRKSSIIDSSANYIDPTILKSFIQQKELDTVNFPLFIQFINHSNEEPLITSTIQKVLSFSDNENIEKNVNNKFLPLLSNIKLLPILYEQLSLFQPTSKTSLCSNLIEKVRLKTLEDGHCFIAQIRSVKTINQFQNLIEIASKENQNQSILEQFEKCHVFEILCNDLLYNRFGSEGIYLMLTLFHSFSSSLLIFIINKLIPNLLQIFTIDGNDNLYNENISLLNEIYDLAPDETLSSIELNLKNLSLAIQKVPDSIFDKLKKFITELDDKIFFCLFLYSKNEEKHFSDIYKELEYCFNQQENKANYYHKLLLVLCQLDEEVPFDKLYKLFLSKLDGEIIDYNTFIVDKLLNMTLIIHSEKNLSLIFNSFDHLSSLSKYAAKSIDDFIVKLSSIKLSDFNISKLKLEQSNSGFKILVSDRSEISSVLQILYRTFPFNLFAFSSTETRFCVNSVSKIQLLFHEMSLCEQKFIDLNDLSNHFIKLEKNPAIFFKYITEICPENWIHEFQGKIKTQKSDNFEENNDFVCLKVPIDKSLNEAIFNQSQIFIKTPSILAIQLIRNNEGEIEIPIHLNIDKLINNENDEKIEYNLTASVILDPTTNEFNSVIKINKENWILFSQKEETLIKNEMLINNLVKNSYLVFYTKHESTVDEPINNALTTLYIENPFNIIEYINGPTSLENISKKNEYFRVQFAVLNESTIKFMINKSSPITLLSYLIHSFCYTTDQPKYAVLSTEKIIKNLSGDEIINYIESDFNSFICCITNTSYLNQIIEILNHSIQNCSNKIELIELMNQFLNRLSKIEFKELNPISLMINKFVFMSNENIRIAQQNNWHQKLVSILFSIFNYNRKYEYLRNLDLSPLFNIITIIITTEFVPNNFYNLFNISEQVFVSKKHNQSYIALLYKLRSLNIIKSESNTNQIISYVNSFQTIIDKSEVPEIPFLLNASKIFKEIQSQIEYGNENLRSNILKVFLPKLFSYLDDKDKNVRDAAQQLIYVLLGYPKKDVYDPAINLLLLSVKDESKCSIKLDVLFDLIKKSKTFDDDYLKDAFDGIQNSKDVSKLLNYILKKSNDTIGQNEVNQFYLDSIVALSDSVVNSDVNLSDPIEVDLNEVISFFNNFWPNLPSEKLILLLNKMAGQNRTFLDDFKKALLDQIAVQIEPNEGEKWQLAVVCNQILLNNRNSLSLNDDDDLANEMKKLHDLACLEHEKVQGANPHFLFALYIDELIENPNAKWITDFASKLLPESKMSSEEEKEFFRLALSNNKEKLVAEEADELRNKNEKSKLDKLNKDKMLNEIKRKNEIENSMKEQPKQDDKSMLDKSHSDNSKQEKSESDQLSSSNFKQSEPYKFKQGQPSSENSKSDHSSSDNSMTSSNKPGEDRNSAKERSIYDKLNQSQASSDKSNQGQSTPDKSKLDQTLSDISKQGQSSSDKSNQEQSAQDQSPSDKLKSVQSSSDSSKTSSAKPSEDRNSSQESSIYDKLRPSQTSSDKSKQGQSTPDQLNNTNGMTDDAANSASETSKSDKSKSDQSSESQLGNEADIPVIDPNSIKERSTVVVEEEEEVDDTNNEQQNKEETVQIKPRKRSSDLAAAEMEQMQLNSLLYGGDDNIEQKDDIGDFSMEEFTNDLNELEDSPDTVTATATAVGTAAITTASYLLYKYMKKSK